MGSGLPRGRDSEGGRRASRCLVGNGTRGEEAEGGRARGERKRERGGGVRYFSLLPLPPRLQHSSCLGEERERTRKEATVNSPTPQGAGCKQGEISLYCSSSSLRVRRKALFLFFSFPPPTKKRLSDRWPPAPSRARMSPTHPTREPARVTSAGRRPNARGGLAVPDRRAQRGHVAGWICLVAGDPVLGGRAGAGGGGSVWSRRNHLLLQKHGRGRWRLSCPLVPASITARTLSWPLIGPLTPS